MNVRLWTDLNNISTDTFNMALMKISAYHKSKGDDVKWHLGAEPCDLLYCSKIFSNDWTNDIYNYYADKVIKGGTGYNLEVKLPDEIEHIYPDYSLYPNLKNTAIGFLTRGCPNNCPFCIVTKKEGNKALHTADLSEFWHGQRNIRLMDNNLLACRDHERLLKQLIDSKAKIRFDGIDARFLNTDNLELLKQMRVESYHFAWDLEKCSEAVKRGLLAFKKAMPKYSARDIRVYVLVNYNTEWKFDLHRINWLKDNGFDPYVMIYEKWNADQKYFYLQRAVNNKYIFWSLENLWDYEPLKPYKLTQGRNEAARCE